MDYKKYETNSTIIDINDYNKTNENSIDGENYRAKFQMQEKVNVNTYLLENVDPMMDILNKSLLYKTYFSVENIKILQNGLRAGLYDISKERFVFPQETTSVNLQLIMKSIISRFGDYTKHDITKEIEMLNEKVLDYCIPFVYKAALSYEIFLKDQLQLIVPLEHSVQSDRDYKQLQSKLW